MKVLQTVEWSVKYAGPISAGWMIPLMLLAALAAWLLYRNQFQGLTRGQRVGLVTLRVALLVALVFIAFKPTLIFRRILTYPGRILMLLDDSGSMMAALRVARRLGDLPAGPESALDAMARRLADAAAALRNFEAYARTADRGQDAFWDRAAAARSEIAPGLERDEREVETLPGLTADEKTRLSAWAGAVREARGGLDLFLTGRRDPGTSAPRPSARTSWACRRPWTSGPWPAVTPCSRRPRTRCAPRRDWTWSRRRSGA